MPRPIDQGPASPIDVSRLPGWSGPGIESSPAVRFAPEVGAATLQAVVLGRDVADDRELLLVVARLGGEVVAHAPVAHVRTGGASRREVLVRLAPWPLGAGVAGVRIDVSVFELSPPRRFAVKALLVELAGGEPRVILDRLVESGDDARDRRATLASRDLDGDGTAELIVDERESGAARRSLVYRRGAAGLYETRERSLFDPRQED